MELRCVNPIMIIILLHGLRKGVLVQGLNTLPTLVGNRLSEGEDRLLPNATVITCGDINIVQLTTRTTEAISDGLIGDNFELYPFTAGAISAPQSQRIIGNKAMFSLAVLNRGRKTQYALQLDEKGQECYWLPQGGTIDIPRFASRHDPKYVFTPDFSGCSWTITPIAGNYLRLRHVEGGMEDVQFNNLRQVDIGGYTTHAMEYKEYGYLIETKRMVSNVPAFAYMRYMPFAGGTWILKFQRKTCAPTLGAFTFYPTTSKVKGAVSVETQSSYPPVSNKKSFRAVDWIPR